MRFDEFGHAAKAEIMVNARGSRHRRTRAFSALTPIDPGGMEAGA
jgi:hypothetical protein